jgi:hypothetical protein
VADVEKSSRFDVADARLNGEPNGAVTRFGFIGADGGIIDDDDVSLVMIVSAAAVDIESSIVSCCVFVEPSVSNDVCVDVFLRRFPATPPTIDSPEARDATDDFFFIVGAGAERNDAATPF